MLEETLGIAVSGTPCGHPNTTPAPLWGVPAMAVLRRQRLLLLSVLCLGLRWAAAFPKTGNYGNRQEAVDNARALAALVGTAPLLGPPLALPSFGPAGGSWRATLLPAWVGAGGSPSCSL